VPLRIAMLGTRGVPAQYGGFETAVEEIGARLAAMGHHITVYCRNPGQSQTSYRGMDLVNLPALRHRMTETLSHTAVSTAHAIIKDRPDVVLMLNAGNAPLLQPLKVARIPTAIHLDGLESRREKWRGIGARYYRWAERAAVKWGDVVIADAQAIADYVEREYGRTCAVIPYGAEVMNPPATRLTELGLAPQEYHLIVARFEPENHILDAVHAYRQCADPRQLIVVGSAPYADWYIDKVKRAAGDDSRIRFIGSLYDAELLDTLYAHARTYIHGHSVGGTNPSLLRAMGAGAPVLAFDVEFNREVTDQQAFFWGNADDLTSHLNDIAAGTFDTRLSELGRLGEQRIRDHYQWDTVAAAYDDLITAMAKS
jgi:glycosyltransferase involved in cell wall biosynthesis